MSKPERTYWDLGEREPFRLSKDRCQRFMEALLLCDGKIHDLHSLDVSHSSFKHGMKAHQVAVLFRISLPNGRADLFEEIMGEGEILTDPPKIQVNGN